MDEPVTEDIEAPETDELAEPSESSPPPVAQLLAEIDPRPFQAQLVQAQGQYERDKALLENANIDLNRYQIAYSKNAIPKQQLDTQVATVHQLEGVVKLDQGNASELPTPKQLTK